VAALYDATSTAGAVLGTAHFSDASVLARYLMMFGLALTSVAVWIVLDAALFAARSAGIPRRRQPARGACGVLGVVWYALAGSWYVFGTWPHPSGRRCSPERTCG